MHGTGANIGYVDGHAEWHRSPGGTTDNAWCRRTFGDPNWL
ncbi:MAG: hypothetical protein KAI66_14295 [Lentisphaeria bacterium]|nr:hypothetical protein [Lentisphaeria bacterium]